MQLLFNLCVSVQFVCFCVCFPLENMTSDVVENETVIFFSDTTCNEIEFPAILYIFLVGGIIATVYSCRMIGTLILRRRDLQNLEGFQRDENSKPYKPVVCIHGLFDPKSSCDILEAVIRVCHCGTKVTVIDLYYGCKSLANLWEQIEAFKTEVEKIAAENPQGIHLIALSQGNMIARGILETSDKHNVDTYISICGPHGGQYGLSMISRIPGYSWLMKHLSKYFYSPKGQNYSVPEFWKDPHQIDYYKEVNKFLPVLNNEISHPRSDEFKKNFSQIKHLVLIGGPNDGCITPWQSSQFAFFDEHENVIPMQDQEIYKNDTLGLKTLDERKAITLISVPHVFHQFFSLDVPFIKEHVVPYLT